MKIINPLYDLAFKYLMQNERFAKKVLSVILEMEIEEVHLQQQEAVYNSERINLQLFRLDFKATVKDTDGNRRTVIIELQKSKYATDIERFRNYLGMTYLNRYPNQEKIKEDLGIVSEPATSSYNGIHPIISIYILGYLLDDLPYLAVTVNPGLIDSVSKKPIKSESFFVAHLTHRAHIIQVKRLPAERRTRLEKFLVFFNQAWCYQQGYILNLEEVPEGYEDMAEYLRLPLLDDYFRRQLELEDQVDRAFSIKEQEVIDSRKLLEQYEQDKQKAEQDKEKAEQDKEKAEQDRKSANSKLIKAIQKMHARGFTVTEIANDLEIPEVQVNKLLKGQSE